MACAPGKDVRDQGAQVARGHGTGVFDTVQRPERRYLRCCGEGDDARNDPAGYPARRGSDGSQDRDLGDQNPPGGTPDDLPDRRLSQYLSECYSEHERHYGRNVQERFLPVACLSVDAEQHDIPGLRVGEYSVVTDERVRIEKSANASEQQAHRQAFGPGTDIGHLRRGRRLIAWPHLLLLLACPGLTVRPRSGPPRRRKTLAWALVCHRSEAPRCLAAWRAPHTRALTRAWPGRYG